MGLTIKQKAKGLRWRVRNRELEAQRSRDWRRDNKEKVRAQLIAWRLAYPEKYRARMIADNKAKVLKRLLNKKPRVPRAKRGERVNVGDMPVIQRWLTQDQWYEAGTGKPIFIIQRRFK